jgi:flagellar hook-length control protein FliK
MSETPTEAPAQPQEGQQEPTAGESTQETPKTFDAEYVEKLRKENARYRTEAKAAAAEVEKIRKSSMTEAEKAVAEAEARGRSAALADFGKRLARTQFDALAGRRNPGINTSEVLEFIDLARFVGEDGEPDQKAIEAAVERLVPAAEAGVPSFDGGTRTTPPAPTGMNGLIRKAAGRA